MVNEKRLIDANALLEKMQFRLPINDKTSEVIAECVEIAVRHIKNAPTVDAVEVVRCKDCKHFDKDKALRPGGIWCGYWGTDPDPSDFCCKGERREGE